MEQQIVLDRVLAFLGKRFPRAEAISDTTRLADSGMMDSLVVLELVMFVEEEFGLQVERGDLDRFDTAANITDLVVSKQVG